MRVGLGVGFAVRAAVGDAASVAAGVVAAPLGSDAAGALEHPASSSVVTARRLIRRPTI
jgi:hypothetical protein